MKVIVIGGGTSGLMASVSAAMHGAEVVLLEKNPTLGKKLIPKKPITLKKMAKQLKVSGWIVIILKMMEI